MGRIAPTGASRPVRIPRRRTLAGGGRRTTTVVLAAVLFAVTGVVAPEAGGGPVSDGDYRATVRRTAHGVPHVLAADLGGAGFGQGWAYAEDRFCDLNDQVVKVRGERARWFGPGHEGLNIATDVAYRTLGLVDRAREQRRRLTGDAGELLAGYVAGYNAFLAQTGSAGLPGWCAGQPWVGPVTETDILAYQRDLAISASGQGLLVPIAVARPPDAAEQPLPVGSAALAGLVRNLLTQPWGDSSRGSNAWAIGADRSASGGGLMMMNPHFPWEGELRLWESHLTVPGRWNVYGASLGGLPGVQLGFNERVSWAHTVAAGSRHTLYSVDLVPGEPTTYLIDGRPEKMAARSLRVEVDWGDGRPRPLSYTAWSTRYGPVLDLSMVDPALAWTGTRAVTYRDANIDNDRLLEQWLAISRATDVAGVRDAVRRHQGVPWLNTLAADRNGDAWYADSSATPNLSPATTAAWSRSPVGLLDGSVSANGWLVREGARSPGLVPFAAQPQATSRDYLLNANDSHWFVARDRLLTGFSPLQGPEGHPLSARTRQNLRLVDATDARGRPHRLDAPALERAVLSGSSLTADALADTVITACRSRGSRPVQVDGTAVDLRVACAALGRWDRRFDVDSRGAVLWRETIRCVLAAHPTALHRTGPLFRTDFDPADPGRAPREPPSDTAPLLAGLACGTLRLQQAGFAADVPLGQAQYVVKAGRRLPVPGGPAEVGIANVVGNSALPGSTLEPGTPGGLRMAGSDLTSRGYPVNIGTSFVMVVAFTDDGPRARALLTFGQSADPRSPYFADQTALFAEARLREVRFTDADVAADPTLRSVTVTGPRPR
ncbi:penicillin acylase family protein [Micromonospora okii]|uniref:penicillin acylase family protein n=1 Tax=Micromonospora okii TaxID=1182970 RepID=UPI001E40ECB0|nr:penicillin acylase family protein [Micromonospora okii]